MFDHVGMRVSDREASRRFFETVLSVLGIRLDDSSRLYDEWDDFSIMAAEDESAVTRGLHVGFPAASRERVDEFWRAGVDAGYRSDGEPGPRPEYGDDYYGGFLLDPDGNSAEAVHYDDGLRKGGVIDHLWIRVADVSASRRFYELVAPFGGFKFKAKPRGEPSSSLEPRRSRSSPGSRRPTFTSPFPPTTTPLSTSSTARWSMPATGTTAVRASGRSTTRATTRLSCSTPTVQTSRS